MFRARSTKAAWHGIAPLTVLGIEAVEAMEGVPVSVHVQGVDREVVRGEVEGLEDLLKTQELAVTECHDVLR